MGHVAKVYGGLPGGPGYWTPELGSVVVRGNLVVESYRHCTALLENLILSTNLDDLWSCRRLSH